MNREGVLWFSLGIGCVLAYKLTIYQLESFKRQCEIIPEESRETVDKATENALKLETLVTLGKGVNYNLSRAAVRIIAERAVSDEVFPSFLRKARSGNPVHRQEALRTLRYLIILGKHKSEAYIYYESDNDHILSKESEPKLQSQAVYNALVRACFNSLPKTLPNGSITERDELSEAYALECLLSLTKQANPKSIPVQRDGEIYYQLNVRPVLQAGIATYMKNIPTPNHAHIVAAFHDPEYQPENQHLYELYNLMEYNHEAELCLRQAGLWIEPPQKIITGLRVPSSFERQVETFHRTLRERFPEARSVEEALEFVSQEENLLTDSRSLREIWE